MKVLSLNLPDRLLYLLEEESRARRKTKSCVVRECLEKKSLARRATRCDTNCYDLARGLAESLRGLPRDLATNPKHMEGFGR